MHVNFCKQPMHACAVAGVEEKMIKNTSNKLDPAIKDIAKELSILLIGLTSWEDDVKNDPGKKIYRSWKGVRFEILDEFHDAQLITQRPGSQCLVVTDSGRQWAKDMKQKYLQVDA